MNCITRFATNLVNRIARADNTSLSQKEIAMNTNCFRHSVARMARGAAGLFALVGLLGFSHKAASADVSIDYMVPPQETYGVMSHLTALQVKVRNNDFFSVSGLRIQTYIYRNADVNNGWSVRAMPTSDLFSLTPYQTKWITIFLPWNDFQGRMLMGDQLYAKAILGSHEVWLKDFYNWYPGPDVRSGAVRSFRSNWDYSQTFSVTYTNKGRCAALPVTTTLSMWTLSNGVRGPVKTVTGKIPALEPGESTTLVFTTQGNECETIYGNIHIEQGYQDGFLGLVDFSLPQS
ncbi:MAG: hypothetical protein JWN14_3177 [Chthonomonadales bacterium]|nr:hypothetical protein [Chthonomonadales bacterium]